MIALHLDRPDFENDFRALLMSFYIGEKILTDEQASRRKPADAKKRGVRPEQVTAEFSAHFDGNEVLLAICGAGRSLSERCCVAGMDRRGMRDAIKTAGYRLLSRFSGRTLPWGTLTGVRPTKIPMEIIERGGSVEQAASHMKESYLVSEEKAQLASMVAKKELALIRGFSGGSCSGGASRKEDARPAEWVPGQPFPGYSLYLGIPFCPSICVYCSFSSYPIAQWAGRVEDYIDALVREIRANASPGRPPLSFYMGGGTPTSITAEQLDRILTELDENFSLGGCPEKTVEAGRPDSITADKLRVMRKHGIDRISINPQTMNQETLDLIGRKHSVQDIVDAFHMAREEGFTNINMDLIAGLPGETAEHMKRTMEQVCALGPDNITVHSLALKRAAFLSQNREHFPVAPADEVNRMIRISRERAREMGLEPYYLYRQKNIAGSLENVGYAREGCECMYNIIIIEEIQSILALGAGSVSKRVYPNYHIERCANVKSVKDYIERIDEMNERKRELFGKA